MKTKLDEEELQGGFKLDEAKIRAKGTVYTKTKTVQLRTTKIHKTRQQAGRFWGTTVDLAINKRSEDEASHSDRLVDIIITVPNFLSFSLDWFCGKHLRDTLQLVVITIASGEDFPLRASFHRVPSMIFMRSEVDSQVPRLQFFGSGLECLAMLFFSPKSLSSQLGFNP